MPRQHVSYRDAAETIEPGEDETFDRIVDVMARANGHPIHEPGKH
jgi:hypothetical protein